MKHLKTYLTLFYILINVVEGNKKFLLKFFKNGIFTWKQQSEI